MLADIADDPDLLKRVIHITGDETWVYMATKLKWRLNRPNGSFLRSMWCFSFSVITNIKYDKLISLVSSWGNLRRSLTNVLFTTIEDYVFILFSFCFLLLLCITFCIAWVQSLDIFNQECHQHLLNFANTHETSPGCLFLSLPHREKFQVIVTWLV